MKGYFPDLPHVNQLCKVLSKLWETVKDREAWHAAVHGAAELDTI